MIREQEKKLHEINEQQYRKSQLYIEENKKKIEELKEKVKSFEQENNDLQQKLLLAKKEKLEQTNQAIEKNNRIFRRPCIKNRHKLGTCACFLGVWADFGGILPFRQVAEAESAFCACPASRLDGRKTNRAMPMSKAVVARLIG